MRNLFLSLVASLVVSATTVAAAGHEVVMTTMSTVGKTISERARSRAEVDAFAEAIGDIFCAYLETLSG
jgi:hypothetical protein